MFGVLAAFDNFEDIMENLFSAPTKEVYLCHDELYIRTYRCSDAISQIRFKYLGIRRNTVSKQTMQLFLEK